MLKRILDNTIALFVVIVVMCSAMGQESMVMDAVRSGAKDFIVKPFKPDRVLKTVTSILGAP